MLQKALLAAVTVGAVLAGVSSANAEGGCGPGGHRTPRGYCVRNYPLYGPRPGYGPGPVIVVDRFYPGRGYWDGHRYWWHRERFNGGWRYR